MEGTESRGVVHHRVQTGTCKGAQECYDEKEEDVLHGCGSDGIAECYAVSFTTAEFVLEGGLVA